MVSGKKSAAERKAKGALVSMSRRSTPWAAIAAVLALVLFAGGVFGYLFWRNRASNERTAAVAAFVPSTANHDPSTQIPGVVVATYKGGTHARPDQRDNHGHLCTYAWKLPLAMLSWWVSRS